MKPRSNALAITALLATVGTAAFAQESPPIPQEIQFASLGPVTVANSDRYSFESRSVGKPFIIDVVRIDSPLSPPAPNDRLPVVFVTDGDMMATMVPSIARLGALELLPSMIIVGIGYDVSGVASPLEAMVAMMARRATDFTPIHDDAYLASVAPVTEQVLGIPWPDDAPLGRADAFLTFIDEELKPFIADRYPAADVGDAALFGHSLGGLFALHVLFTSPQSFDRYIALSPAVNYGDEVLLEEETRFGDLSARVFVAVGGEDVPVILESATRFDSRITAHARPSLRYAYKLFPGETHASVIPGGVMAGLRAVFDPPPPPPGFAVPEPEMPTAADAP